jgi:hypothetical protein
MVDYANGKIYKIVGEDGTTYYGSTTLTLKMRKRKHRMDETTSAYRKIISQMNWDMILIENYPCESKKELEQREAWYIRENPCVNQCIPGRTSKEWREDNRERLKPYHEEYRNNHRDRAKAYAREHRIGNKVLTEKAKLTTRWIRSFGDPRFTNSVQRCDYKLFQ